MEWVARPERPERLERPGRCLTPGLSVSGQVDQRSADQDPPVPVCFTRTLVSHRLILPLHVPLHLFSPGHLAPVFPPLPTWKSPPVQLAPSENHVPAADSALGDLPQQQFPQLNRGS